MMRSYPIIIEKAPNNYAAYSPDVPGCVATGNTVEGTIAEMREALAFHFESLRDYGDPIPEPTTFVSMVEIQMPAHGAKTEALSGSPQPHDD